MEFAVLFTAVSLSSILLGVIVLPIVIVRMPEDYFAGKRRDSRWVDWGVQRKVLAVFRSAFGFALVVAGVMLLFLPGQGLLTILAGIVIAEFPGKYRLERWILRRPAVFSALDGIRRRAGKASFRLEEEGGEEP